MKTLESIISLLVFVSIAIMLIPEPKELDYSVYKTQIANDIWRVFELRNNFVGFDKNKLNDDANKITELTSLCIEFEEEDVTSCIPETKTIQIRKMAIVDGNPKTITMRIGQNNQN